MSMSTAPEILKRSQTPSRAAAQNVVLETARNLLRNRSAVAGLMIIGFLIFLAIFAPQAAMYNPTQSMIGQPGETGKLPGKPPCLQLFGCTDPQHPMGLDLNARDMYSRIVYATRTSLTVGFTSISIAVIVGTLIGLIAGYAGGWVDNIFIRILGGVLAVPSLLLGITIVTIRRPGLDNALFLIAVG